MTGIVLGVFASVDYKMFIEFNNNEYTIQLIVEKLKRDLFVISEKIDPRIHPITGEGMSFQSFDKMATDLGVVNGNRSRPIIDGHGLVPVDRALIDSYYFLDILLASEETTFKGEALKALLDSLYLYTYTKIVCELFNGSGFTHHVFLEELYNKNNAFFEGRFAKKGRDERKSTKQAVARRAQEICLEAIKASDSFSVDDAFLAVIQEQVFRELKLRKRVSINVIKDALLKSSIPEVAAVASKYEKT